jgi:hypothetical protein
VQRWEEQEPCKGQVALHRYQEDTPRRAPKWAFLGGGFVPLGLNEDVLAVVAAELDRTCEIPSRRVNSVNTTPLSHMLLT